MAVGREVKGGKWELVEERDHDPQDKGGGLEQNKRRE